VSTRYLLEIASNSAMSAVAAQQGGADRIELFENLEQGGTTPSAGTIAVARDALRIPLYVLIRHVRPISITGRWKPTSYCVTSRNAGNWAATGW